MFLSSTEIFEASKTNSVDPDQTAPIYVDPDHTVPKGAV